MATSLSIFDDNIFEGICKIKYKFRGNDKKCKMFGIKYEYCNYFLKQTSFKVNLIGSKCLCCLKIYQNKFDEKLKERFFIADKISSHGNNKFVSLL